MFLPSARAQWRGPLKAPQPSFRFARLAVWLRGEAATWRFFSPSAAADAAAAVRETEPSMGPQPLKRVHKLASRRERAALI